jgi:hypothetical protein
VKEHRNLQSVPGAVARVDQPGDCTSAIIAFPTSEVGGRVDPLEVIVQSGDPEKRFGQGRFDGRVSSQRLVRAHGVVQPSVRGTKPVEAHLWTARQQRTQTLRRVDRERHISHRS